MAEKRRKRIPREKLICGVTRLFLELGYTKTSTSIVCKELNISSGTLTFQFPTKEHLLLELVKGMTVFQWQMTTEMEHEGASPLLAYALEIKVSLK